MHIFNLVSEYLRENEKLTHVLGKKIEFENFVTLSLNMAKISVAQYAPPVLAEIYYNFSR